MPGSTRTAGSSAGTTIASSASGNTSPTTSGTQRRTGGAKVSRTANTSFGLDRSGSRDIDRRPADCDRDFVSESARLSHWANSVNHHWCAFCHHDSSSQGERDEHFNDEHWRCHGCDEWFATERGMDEHARQSHYYCMQHGRFFANQNGLDNVSSLSFGRWYLTRMVTPLDMRLVRSTSPSTATIKGGPTTATSVAQVLGPSTGICRITSVTRTVE